MGRRRDVPVTLVRDGGELAALRERALAALEALAEQESAAGRPRLREDAERARDAALSSARTAASPDLRDPHPLLGALSLAGWLMWSGAAFAFVTRGLDSASRLTPKAWRMLACMVAGFALFAAGLAFA